MSLLWTDAAFRHNDTAWVTDDRGGRDSTQYHPVPVREAGFAGRAGDPGTSPDAEDPELMHFLREHGTNRKLWHDKGRTGKVNIRQPVWATQAFVAREHVDKYKSDPGAAGHREQTGGAEGLPGDDHPMFVTHHGRLHVSEGHHRVAAELEQGTREMHGGHFNLDEHPQYGHLTGRDVSDDKDER